MRNWRRYQAIRLLAQGQTPVEVAEAVGCRFSSVYNWVAAWKHCGNAGLHEDHHGGHTWLLDTAGQRELETLLATDPHEQVEQATEWTVPLLLTDLSQAGYAVSQHTLRRSLHRLGWRWKRPRYELGRPDPAYEGKKVVVEQISAVLEAGGEVWMGDETLLREFPPLRASWSRRGEQKRTSRLPSCLFAPRS